MQETKDDLTSLVAFLKELNSLFRELSLLRKSLVASSLFVSLFVVFYLGVYAEVQYEVGSKLPYTSKIKIENNAKTENQRKSKAREAELNKARYFVSNAKEAIKLWLKYHQKNSKQEKVNSLQIAIDYLGYYKGINQEHLPAPFKVWINYFHAYLNMIRSDLSYKEKYLQEGLESVRQISDVKHSELSPKSLKWLTDEGIMRNLKAMKAKFYAIKFLRYEGNDDRKSLANQAIEALLEVDDRNDPDYQDDGILKPIFKLMQDNTKTL